MMTMRRDPFARGEYVRRLARTAFEGSCDWCGMKKRRLYTYAWAHDGGRMPPEPDEIFCDFSCFESYHG